MLHNRKYRVAQAYLDAKLVILREGFLNEVSWQGERHIDVLTETSFLSEAAWSILSAGMAEAVVRRKFRDVSTAFYNWQSASKIVEQHRMCVREALSAFRHERKINTIMTIARHVADSGFETVMSRLRRDGMTYLEELDTLGPVTRIHFAKNIGLDVIKPDRHLVRIAEVFGYRGPQEMCEEIASLTNERLCVIDSVLWRYATLRRNYVDEFRAVLQ